MTYNTLELEGYLMRDGLASFICERFTEMNNQRQPWIKEKQEIRNYIFATDTSTTSNKALPWKNSTTIPKLCQIRDNLHANYMSSLFPNDDWMKWEGYSIKDEVKKKKKAVQAYLSNKVRESGMRNTISKLLYDYIDWGVAIADVIWVNEQKEDARTGEMIAGYVGPKTIRRSILDVVFDSTADDFKSSWKITRSLKRIGELELEYRTTGSEEAKAALEESKQFRRSISGMKSEDFEKATSYSIDGFGNLFSYYGSDYVELLEFEGTIHDPDTGELLDDYIITVMDRRKVVRKQRTPAWKRGGMKVMTSWRKRPDNLYGMGPLDNLVGMQYRLDHLENLKADVLDLIVAPPLKIMGDVDEFEWGPFSEISIGENGDVVPLTPPAQALMMNQEIGYFLQLMEEMAGAPKQAMGIRTPGEKTAFEVQALENAAGRIFQEKITQFEVELLEPCLNNMLETAVRNMQYSDVVRVMDDDLGVADFITITKEDITAKGKIRPIGARHFSARAQLLQNLSGIANSNVWPKVEPHIGDKALAKLVEEVLQLERFTLVSDNAGLMDKMESQRLMNQGMEDLEVEQETPIEEDLQ